MAAIDMVWDEDRGGPRNHLNLLSCPKDEPFVKATRDILPWSPGGIHAANTAVLPSVYAERLCRKAPCKNPNDMSRTIRMLTHCLDATFMAKVLHLLMEEGLFEATDNDGNVAERNFDSYDELRKMCGRMLLQLQDDATVQVDDAAFDWLEDCNHNQADAQIVWFHDLTSSCATPTTSPVSQAVTSVPRSKLCSIFERRELQARGISKNSSLRVNSVHRLAARFRLLTF